jgi:hypothetical protein
MKGTFMLQEILNKEIFWKKNISCRGYWFANIDGKLVILRLNNFPDDPLLTFINGMEIVDMVSRPKLWHLE